MEEQIMLQAQQLELTRIQTNLSLVMLIVTVISVGCAFLAYKHQKLRSKKDASCALAKFYADDIIKRIGFVHRIIVNAGLDQKINTAFPFDRISEFSMDEAAKIIDGGQDKLGELLREINQIDPRVIYDVKILCAKTIEERHALAKEYLVLAKDESGMVISSAIAHQNILVSEFSQDILDLLNVLEGFAMNFHYNLADEKILYQSLHQTYLSNIWLLYPYICRQNQKGNAKYYTNIIWLFNLWKKRLRKLEAKALKSKFQKEQRLKQLEDERNAANQRYEKEKQKCSTSDLPVYTGKPL